MINIPNANTLPTPLRSMFGAYGNRHHLYPAQPEIGYIMDRLDKILADCLSGTLEVSDALKMIDRLIMRGQVPRSQAHDAWCLLYQHKIDLQNAYIRSFSGNR